VAFWTVDDDVFLVALLALDGVFVHILLYFYDVTEKYIYSIAIFALANTLCERYF
jgi:hypothetical protein